MAFDPRMTDESDVALLMRCAEGDPSAAAELYRRHAGPVYRFVWMVTGSDSEAADVLQETFIALLERRSGYDPARGSCTAYLCGVARHLVYRRFDSRSEPVAEIEQLAEDSADSAASLLPPPHEHAERAQALARLRAAIRALPSHYRDILVLVELQEMSYADAAAVAGIEIGTVRSRLARARARLAELLNEPMAIGRGQGT